MKVVGIVTEYNPFHKGHKFHIDEAKRITGADYVIAVMSGDFVQRGAPAIINKYDRTLMALNNGVDLLLELPACYATASAQYFALGAVALLNSLGIVDYICFGSECGDISALSRAASLFHKPSESFQNILYSYIREGYTYPAARAKATEQILTSDEEDEKSSNNDSDNIMKLISEPNNILGIEYLRALLQLDSSIKPFTIKRYKAPYHESIINHNSISSATAIRCILEKAEGLSDLSSLNSSIPKNIIDYFIENHYSTYPITLEDFSSIIKYKLMSETSLELSKHQDLSSDIADRIKNIDICNQSVTDLAQSIKTKNITLSRVNRALIHVLLNIKSASFSEYKDDDIIYYARVLGIKKEASHLVRKIKKYERLPVITKVAAANKQLSPLGLQMLNQDIFATHLYNQNLYNKFKTIRPNEYKHGIVILS